MGSTWCLLFLVAFFASSHGFFCGRRGTLCTCDRTFQGTLARCSMDNPEDGWPSFSRRVRKHISLQLVFSNGHYTQWRADLQTVPVRSTLNGFRSVLFTGKRACGLAALLRHSKCLSSAHVCANCIFSITYLLVMSIYCHLLTTYFCVLI